ncbi:hypothetical protein D6R50_10750 [Aeromonas veronii]|uniref:DNA-binding protein H-NS-like N-terminal domain-containing protein n=1 Tax=Aeromonas veronii TaxID=654 RepID=A0A3A9IF19_AERVE|nr:hypothetical protein [Aeromonas veronii]RKJ84532.1 hypothetical protein D6R50_23080 [Aeromonas veronii]RKJ86163.1 hypothetical protein D6R50_17830 [Aeromonas veronii]RKJ87218.1 hypothetical protein D6R50_13105 [Aeromonas veronii]RKJ88968.1 hypothetical protein D6R50_06650 [Aeromonas veronii]RKJ89477.1 hypothetical protein D6R50_09480 [Aeromonas veronii]
MKIKVNDLRQPPVLREMVKLFSSEELLALNEVIESITLERMEEEARSEHEKMVKQEVIAHVKEQLQSAGLEPKDLIAFMASSPRALKQQSLR